MIKFDKEELLKIATLSELKLNEEESNLLVKQIKLVLDYTEELEQVTPSKETAPIKNVNVFREDKARKFDSSKIMQQAPETKDNYFVVPQILK
ncbi:Asp-tRNA(Asn)/Glu-tRNA(Gln) amidotransferase subunit GatC [Candidatus Dependentiae bacterium]